MTRARVRGAAVLSVCCALLWACGGGGGGGVENSVTISPDSLTFTAIRGGPTPPSQEISAVVAGQYHDAVAGTMGQPPPWIAVDWANPSAPVVVSVTTTDLEPGQHTATVRIGTISEDNTGIAWADALVTYDVLPMP